MTWHHVAVLLTSCFFKKYTMIVCSAYWKHPTGLGQLLNWKQKVPGELI